MYTIDVDDLDDLARGAAILGTGGGGDPYIGKLIAAEAIREHGPVNVVNIEDVAPDALVVSVAVMGAPTVMVEKTPAGTEATSAIAGLNDVLEDKIAYIACLEAGGINSMIPIAAAAETGLPLLDADGMGRAFPELQMTMQTLAEVSSTPMSLADERGNRAVFRTVDNQWAERLARVVTVEMGCWSFVALYPMRGYQLSAAQVPKTVSWAQRLGAAVRHAGEAHDDPVAAAVTELAGFRLFTGKVADVERNTEGGFARGSAIVDGLDSDHGSTLRLQFQNEHLTALSDGVLKASVPDLLCVLDSESGEPITTEAMRYGLRVSVIGAPCHWRWRTPQGIDTVGPHRFGLHHKYRPVEELCQHIGEPAGAPPATGTNSAATRWN